MLASVLHAASREALEAAPRGDTPSNVWPSGIDTLAATTNTRGTPSTGPGHENDKTPYAHGGTHTLRPLFRS